MSLTAINLEFTFTPPTYLRSVIIFGCIVHSLSLGTWCCYRHRYSHWTQYHCEADKNSRNEEAKRVLICFWTQKEWPHLLPSSSCQVGKKWPRCWVVEEIPSRPWSYPCSATYLLRVIWFWQLLNFSDPQFPFLENGVNATSLSGLVGFSEIKYG